VTGASFTAAYVGQVAADDVMLRDLDRFWDANGKFMLEDPQTLTLIQGDGTKASVTLYATDTIRNVQEKLNAAIRDQLGQGQYVSSNADRFVTYVSEDDEASNTPEAVAGTFVIEALLPGTNGELSFAVTKTYKGPEPKRDPGSKKTCSRFAQDDHRATLSPPT
jgi:flagellin